MAIVAGVDFGTLSVRVSIVDSEKGRLGSATAGISSAAEARRSGSCDAEPRGSTAGAHRAMRMALEAAGVSGDRIEAIALDTTGSSVIPVGADMEPAQRLLLVVRSPGLERSRRDHADGEGGKARSHRLVRRRVFVGMGVVEAAALAAPQSGETGKVRDGI